MITSISPIDGRYASKTQDLSAYFSEYALIKYRVWVEVKYFIALCKKPLPQLAHLGAADFDILNKISTDFSEEDALRIKEIERTTNHDVKAVEYFIKEKLEGTNIESSLEFIHFGLTSQDINNTSVPASIKDALDEVYYPTLTGIIGNLNSYVKEYEGVSMLAKTHGQPASPTTLGKELKVFVERIELQLANLKSLPIMAKFGGATGNLNAHKVSYPDHDWIAFANEFVTTDLGMQRMQTTTQIAHYDHLAAIFDAMSRIHTILIDFARDIWTYISMDYFKQKTIAGEVGSSAMPHKVNPIDFENAEGNLGMANAIFHHLSAKLPISRLQRDLTDSTVLRNVGIPFGHALIAFKSLEKGLSKLELNKAKIDYDLDQNWAVVAEAIQNILRREGYPKPYEALKALTRGNHKITEASIQEFITNLDVSQEIKTELGDVNPYNYVGYY